MSHRDNAEKLIKKYERRLQKLREQQAARGMDTPPHILTEIEDTEEIVRELRVELEALKGRGFEEPPSVHSESDEATTARRLSSTQVTTSSGRDSPAKFQKSVGPMSFAKKPGLNSIAGSDQDPTQIDIIQMQLLGEKYPLAETKQKTLVDTIAGICDLSPDRIQLLDVKAEGFWLCLAVAKPAAERLAELFETKDQGLSPLLAEFRVKSISLLPVQRPQTGLEGFGSKHISLVRWLYLGTGRVLIEQELGGGYGGAQVLLAQPINQQGKPLARQIIKISEGPELRYEYDNSVQLVEKDLPLIAARVANYAEFGGLVGITYTFMGDGILGQTRTLEAYYQDPQVSTKEFIQTLFELLNEALGQSWYRHSRPHVCPFAEEYGPHLAEHLRLKLRLASTDGIWPANQAPALIADYKQLAAEAIVPSHQNIAPGTLVQVEGLTVSKVKLHQLKLQHPAHPGLVVKVESQLGNDTILAFSPGDKVVVRGEVIHNRLGRLEEVVTAAFSGFPEAVVDVKQDELTWGANTDQYLNPLRLYPQILNQTLRGKKSMVHGDLHLRNVLVDQKDRGWLIDFARVTERHNLYDFIKLETYIRQMILSQERYQFSFAAYLQFEKALVAASLGQVTTLPEHLDLQKAFQVIQLLRQIAAHYMGYPANFHAEYFPALFLYNLAILKYYDDQAKWATRLAFATAAVVGKALTEDAPEPMTRLSESEPIPALSSPETADDDEQSSTKQITTGDDAITQAEARPGDAVNIQHGDRISVGNVYGNKIIIGSGGQMTINESGAEDSIAQLFGSIYQQIETHPEDPDVDREELIDLVKKIQQEVVKGKGANAKKVERWLNHLKDMAPDIAKAVAIGLTQPVAGVGSTIRQIAAKIGAEIE